MVKDARELLRNGNYLLLLSTYALMYGVYACLGAILNTLVEPYGFDSADAAIFGGVFITSGLIGSFVASGILDKYAAYKKVTCASCWGTLIFGSMLLGTFLTGNIIIVSINIACMGFFILPILPIGYSFAVEITYPVSEVMSNGTMMLVAQLLGTLLTGITSEIHAYHDRMVAPFLMIIVLFPCLLCLNIKEDLRRVNAESEVTPHHAPDSFFDENLMIDQDLVRDKEKNMEENEEKQISE